VIKVAVQAGQTVKAGDTILVLEAMKMETNISAPKDGQVTSIAVSEGDTVASGDTLLLIA